MTNVDVEKKVVIVAESAEIQGEAQSSVDHKTLPNSAEKKMSSSCDLLEALFWTLKTMIVAIFRACLPIGVLKRKKVGGKIVLITGCGSGLGRELAKRFASEEARLVLWDINEKGNEETARLCRQLEAECFTYTVDVSSREAIYKAAKQVRSEVGDVEILINNAGVINNGSFMDIPDERIQKLIDVNVMANIWTVRSFLPWMIENNKGHIVTVSSVAGLVGAAGIVDYSTSKFANRGFTEAIRHEMLRLGKEEIKTTTICPFYFSSTLTNDLDPFSMPKNYQDTLLDFEMVVDRSMEAILTEAEILMIPRPVYLLNFCKSFSPAKVYERYVTYTANHC